MNYIIHTHEFKFGLIGFSFTHIPTHSSVYVHSTLNRIVLSTDTFGETDQKYVKE